MSGFKALLNLLGYLFLASLWFVLLGSRVTDPGGLYPDPGFDKNLDPYTNVEKENRIQILPNFEVIKFTFYFVLTTQR